MYGYVTFRVKDLFFNPRFFQETIFRERAEMEEDAELIATQRAELQAKMLARFGEGWGGHPAFFPSETDPENLG
jgi:hypothetical protein